jgi:hypothetical protein
MIACSSGSISVAATRGEMPMKRDSTSKDEVIRLGLIYCGLVALLFLLPENSPMLNGVVLGLYAVVSFILVEHKRDPKQGMVRHSRSSALMSDHDGNDDRVGEKTIRKDFRFSLTSSARRNTLRR